VTRKQVDAEGGGNETHAVGVSGDVDDSSFKGKCSFRHYAVCLSSIQSSRHTYRAMMIRDCSQVQLESVTRGASLLDLIYIIIIIYLEYLVAHQHYSSHIGCHGQWEL
jgi:hypothetical protein